MSAPGTLYLLPTGLGSDAPDVLLPAATREIALGLRHFIAERPKTARAFLKQIGYPHPLNETSVETLDKDTPASALSELLAPLLAGSDAALLSEAGCPAVADPGALLVREAHAAGVRVIPLIGPSAILLALMASGLNGQRFMFHGYLPVAAPARAAQLRELEKRSQLDDATQIFIETPYRNDTMLQALLEHCAPRTLLCVAVDLTLPSEQIITRRIEAWRGHALVLDRRPAVFLLYSGGQRAVNEASGRSS